MCPAELPAQWPPAHEHLGQLGAEHRSGHSPARNSRVAWRARRAECTQAKGRCRLEKVSLSQAREGNGSVLPRLPWVGSVGRGPLRNGRNARAVPCERCRQARHRRSSPTSRVSRRVDAGASNPSATNQVRPAHLDLKSIAKCKAHRGEALVCGPRLTPYDSCLHSPPSNDT